MHVPRAWAAETSAMCISTPYSFDGRAGRRTCFEERNSGEPNARVHRATGVFKTAIEDERMLLPRFGKDDLFFSARTKIG